MHVALSDREKLLAFESAFDVLVPLLRAEYPDRYTLSEIVTTWGPSSVSEEQLRAVHLLESGELRVSGRNETV